MTISLVLSCTMVSAFVWAANSTEEARCRVDVNLACAMPADASQIITLPLTWTRKNQANRTTLYNSSDVQKTVDGCVKFAHIIKTECAIKAPVTTIFMTGPGMPIVTSMVIGFEPQLSCQETLGPAFKNYFAKAGVTGSPGAASCPPKTIPIVEYNNTSMVLTAGRAMLSTKITNRGGAVTSCAVYPALPSGLLFNTSDCTISGTPTIVSELKDYVAQASNSFGASNPTKFKLRVDALAPQINYPEAKYRFVVGTTITSIAPTNSGAAITSCAVLPALPAGLTLNSANCTIAGKPTVVTKSIPYLIMAKGANGQGSRYIQIEIGSAPLTYCTFNSDDYGPVQVQVGKTVRAYISPVQTNCQATTAFVNRKCEPNGGLSGLGYRYYKCRATTIDEP